MKNKSKIVFSVLAAILIIAIIALVFKIISGTFKLLGGALDAILGIIIIVVLCGIVIWMFRYADKKRK